MGGLLSAHLLSQKAGVKVEPNWPCEGPLLRLAVDLARRLLPGFYDHVFKLALVLFILPVDDYVVVSLTRAFFMAVCPAWLCYLWKNALCQ